MHIFIYILSEMSVLCISDTVDLVIFTCLNFRNIFILGLFAKLRSCQFFFFFSSSIMIIIFARFLNLRIWPPRQICEN